MKFPPNGPPICFISLALASLHHVPLTLSYQSSAPFTVIRLCNATETAAAGCYKDEESASRFQDNEELRFSLRSVWKFAPWIRKIFIVTNGQIPAWLNVQHPRIHLIPHETIFANSSHLPTFSSPAIEANLHRIPGLSEHFLYLNDDVMFGRAITPADFYTQGNGQRIYFAWAAPDCAEGCGANWIGDGYCDVACNCTECGWDNGDCANATNAGATGTNWGWPHAQSGDFVPQCSSGCLDTWLGDRYCDRACRNPECGMDAGDCGIDLVYENMAGLSLTSALVHTINDPENAPPAPLDVLSRIPVIKVGNRAVNGHDLNLASMFYFNLSSLVEHGSTIIDPAYSNPSFVRVLTVSPKNNVMIVYLTPTALRLAADPSSTTASPTSEPVSTKNHEPETPDQAPLAANDNTTVPLATPAPASQHNSSLPRNRIFITFTTRNGNRESKEHMFFLELYKHDATVKAPLAPVNTSTPAPALSPATSVENVTTQARQLLSIKEVREDDSGHFGTESLGADDTTIFARANEKLEEKTVYRLTRQGMTKQKLKEHVELMSKVGRHGLDILPQITSEEPYEDSISTEGTAQRHLLDHYGESLKHVGKLLNQAFAPEARRVPAHMPHYLQKSVIERMVNMWPAEFDATSSHQTRAGDDMQYAFSYFYYYMGERQSYNFTQLWDAELDVNHDGILDANEMRTIAATLVRSEAANPKPNPRTAFMNWNTWAAGRIDEPPAEPTFQWLHRCDDLWVHWLPELALPPPVHEATVPISDQIIEDAKAALLRQEAAIHSTTTTPTPVTVPAPVRAIYPVERLGEFNITIFPRNWTMTREQLLNCSWAMKPLEMHYKARLMNRWEPGNGEEVAFFMVPTNRSEVVHRLDDIRHQRNKFICLNDNINHTDAHAAEVIDAIQDFFAALYPMPSPFELPHGQTNKFLHTSDLFAARDAIRDKKRWLYFLLIGVVIVILLALRYFAKRTPGAGNSRSSSPKPIRHTHVMRHHEP